MKNEIPIRNPREHEPQAKRGVLYIVATPIGNLSDLTLRALDVLKQSDVIACEDTRQTLKLLNRFQIQKPLIAVFGPKEERQAPKIVDLLSQSKSVAFLTDAGTPGISDPGHVLVRAARDAGFAVEAVPGVSAVSCALSISGMGENGFIFLGFLHRRKSRIRKELSAAAALGLPVAFFESPFRLKRTLALAAEALGGDCGCWVGRELTKKFEEHFSGSLQDISGEIRDREILGEITVIVQPRKKGPHPDLPEDAGEESEEDA